MASVRLARAQRGVIVRPNAGDEAITKKAQLFEGQLKRVRCHFGTAIAGREQCSS